MQYKIPISKPNLTKDDFAEIKKCFDSTWISSKSPWVEKFEKLFAKKVSNNRNAISVNSATSAIFLALKALGIGRGDEVILPTFTMIATVNAVELSGATPVLVDCASYDNWNLDVAGVERKITKKTKAIIPVHIYGYPCRMAAIMSLAKKHKVFIIEDAAEAMGSKYKGKNVGSLGHMSCFSLYSNKIITAGNGGVVCTNDTKLAQKVRQLSFFDYNTNTHFTHRIVGYNLVLSGLQAALALSQLKRFDKFLAKRKLVYKWYLKYLGKNEALRFITPTIEQDPNFWFPAAVFSSKKLRDKAQEMLVNKRIETRVFFRPVHLQPAYRKLFTKQRYPNSEYFFKRGLLLPSYYDITENEVRFVCKVMNGINLSS